VSYGAIGGLILVVPWRLHCHLFVLQTVSAEDALRQGGLTVHALPAQIAQVLDESKSCISNAEIRNLKENRKLARQVMADAAKSEIYKPLNIATQPREP
jgi:hypothetical protein